MRKVGLAVKIPQEIKDEVSEEVETRMGFRLHRLIIENITKDKIIDTGLYRSSWRVERQPNGDVLVFSDVKYGPPLEFGTVPHHPPVNAIKSWARRVLGLKGKDLEGASWAIAKKIAREGTSPRPHVRPALSKLKQEFS